MIFYWSLKDSWGPCNEKHTLTQTHSVRITNLFASHVAPHWKRQQKVFGFSFDLRVSGDSTAHIQTHLRSDSHRRADCIISLVHLSAAEGKLRFHRPPSWRTRVNIWEWCRCCLQLQPCLKCLWASESYLNRLCGDAGCLNWALV